MLASYLGRFTGGAHLCKCHADTPLCQIHSQGQADWPAAPMAYLQAMRLELARAELANAGRQGRASVAAVANGCGFAHLGRFARDYQTRFGELPFATLHRASVGRAR